MWPASRGSSLGKVAKKLGDELPPNQLQGGGRRCAESQGPERLRGRHCEVFRSQTAVREVIDGARLERALFVSLCARGVPSMTWRVSAMAWWGRSPSTRRRAPVRRRRDARRSAQVPTPRPSPPRGWYDAGRGLSSRASLVAQWLTTAKMLTPDPTNIYCDPASLVISRGITGDGLPRSFDLEADVRLRDERFAGCVGPFDEREATASLRVSYWKRPRGRHGGTTTRIEAIHSLRTTPPEL